MMELNLKSYHSILAAAILFMSCNPPALSTEHKCQAAIVLDKTNSVDYTQRLSDFQTKLKDNFLRTYDLATQDIQCSRLSITGHTRGFPQIDHFNKPYPDGDGRDGEVDRQMWKLAKRKWLFEELAMVDSLIKAPCHANTTDIFPIFSGIQQLPKSNDPLDSTNVFIFSDMINTSRFINLNSDININDAYNKGKKICQDLIGEGQISTGNTNNLYLTIYTPDKMDNSTVIYQFWKGFFTQWGLPETHFHFE